MENIIFRAYDHNKWIHFQMGQIWTDSQFEKYKTLCLNGAQFFQFIGFVDKNGKEIYEGDIIKLDYEYDSDYDGDMPIVKRTAGKQIIKNIFDNFRILAAKAEGDRVEIIGNKLETPELL